MSEADATEETFDALAADLARLFSRGTPLDDGAFDGWALRVFRWQFEHDPIYRGYCAGLGVTPETARSWTDVPPVPTSAFKHLRLFAGEGPPDAVFETSGTTQTQGRAERRGEHVVASLALYRSALLPTFHAHVLPDGARLPIVALLPSPALAPRSSLATMIGAVVATTGAGGAFFAASDGTLDHVGLLRTLRRTIEANLPVLVATTAFALVHFLDILARENETLSLPDGSRLMETGGFKGRSRAVERAELYEAVGARLGVPANQIVNEYGMTEMLSQFYEPVLSRPTRDWTLAERFHVGPHWVRTRILDPVSLEPVPDGEPGLLCHHDLANAGSVAAILTEDMGVKVEDGFRLLGRAPGAEPRGCSLATEALIASRASWRGDDR